MTTRETFAPDLATVLGQLVDLIERENALLAENRPSAIEPLLAEKTRLARVYAKMSAELKADRTLVEGAGAEVANAIKTLAARFRAALDSQSRKLETARRVTEGLIAAVGRQVVEQRQPVLGYGRDAGLRTAAAGGASFALNRSV
jgi:hypothetical protein